MFRSFRSLTAALIASLALATISLVAAPTSTKAKSQSIVGTLQKFDQSGKTLTVQTSKGSETLPLSANAKINMGSKNLTASDLASHTGAKVKVWYTESNGQKTAETVHLATAAPEKSTTKSMKK